jgi:alkanesulfonate monooxygenase SsuD/methylene tetrahydromethanopterin reductase-like flavin-dependent oxidoreductase (luciferase family)
MHLSVFMGPLSLGERTDLRQIELCIDQAIRAADAGFAMVTFGEQHFNGYEPYSNPFLMGARLAPHLGETWFGTTIVPLPFHHPFRLAEDSNVLDLLTRGRFLMGLSAGRVGFSPDFQNFGLDPAERHEIFASKLGYLTRAQKQKEGDPPIVLDSKWDRGGLVGRLMPVSWRKGGAQLAVGTNTDETIDEAAARGLPVFLGPCSPDDAAAKLERHRRGLAAAGLSDAAQTDAARKSLVTRHVFAGDTDEAAWSTAEALAGRNPMMDRSEDRRSLQELAKVDPASLRDGSEKYPRNVAHVRDWMLGGSPDSLIEQLRGYAASGLHQLNIRFTAGVADPVLVERSFDLFVREVLPHVGNELFPPLGDDEIDPAHLSGVAA